MVNTAYSLNVHRNVTKFHFSACLQDVLKQLSAFHIFNYPTNYTGKHVVLIAIIHLRNILERQQH
jgi:hypothetical protein